MDARIFALNLPYFGFSAVHMMDIRIHHPKKRRMDMDRSSGIKKAQTDTDCKMEFRGHLWYELLESVLGINRH